MRNAEDNISDFWILSEILSGVGTHTEYYVRISNCSFRKLTDKSSAPRWGEVLRSENRFISLNSSRKFVITDIFYRRTVELVNWDLRKQLNW